jgi:hypothetical protein
MDSEFQYDGFVNVNAKTHGEIVGRNGDSVVLLPQIELSSYSGKIFSIAKDDAFKFNDVVLFAKFRQIKQILMVIKDDVLQKIITPSTCYLLSNEVFANFLIKLNMQIRRKAECER